MMTQMNQQKLIRDNQYSKTQVIQINRKLSKIYRLVKQKHNYVDHELIEGKPKIIKFKK